jgi:hypothetical protein
VPRAVQQQVERVAAARRERQHRVVAADVHHLRGGWWRRVRRRKLHGSAAGRQARRRDARRAHTAGRAPSSTPHAHDSQARRDASATRGARGARRKRSAAHPSAPPSCRAQGPPTTACTGRWAGRARAPPPFAHGGCWCARPPRGGQSRHSRARAGTAPCVRVLVCGHVCARVCALLAMQDRAWHGARARVPGTLRCVCVFV